MGAWDADQRASSGPNSSGPGSSDPYTHAAVTVLLSRWSRELDHRMRRTLRYLGLRGIPSSLLLVLLDADEDGLPITEVSTRLAWPQAHLSIVVRQLEAEQLGERCGDPTDGRRKLLRLTAEGRNVADLLSSALATSTALGQLSTRERSQLLKLLSRGPRKP